MTDKPYAISGELRAVVEEVAEKAANSAVEKMRLRIQLDLLEMEKRLSQDVTDTIDDRIQKALGMTPQEHIIQHDQIRRTSDFFGGLNMAFWKRALLALIFGGLAFLGGYATDFKASKKPPVETQAITRDESHYPRQEAPHASDPKL